MSWSRDRWSRQAFGPEYWLPRCDGFSVVGANGRRGEVDEIVELDEVVRGVIVRFGPDLEYVDEGRIVDVDPVMRTVLVDEE